MVPLLYKVFTHNKIAQFHLSFNFDSAVSIWNSFALVTWFELQLIFEFYLPLFCDFPPLYWMWGCYTKNKHFNQWNNLLFTESSWFEAELIHVVQIYCYPLVWNIPKEHLCQHSERCFHLKYISTCIRLFIPLTKGFQLCEIWCSD